MAYSRGKRARVSQDLPSGPFMRQLFARLEWRSCLWMPNSPSMRPAGTVEMLMLQPEQHLEADFHERFYFCPCAGVWYAEL